MSAYYMIQDLFWMGLPVAIVARLIQRILRH